MLAKTRHPLRRLQHARVDPVGQQAEDRVAAGDRRAQLVGERIRSSGFDVDLVGGLAQQARAGLGDRLGDEDTSWHATSLVAGVPRPDAIPEIHNILASTPRLETTSVARAGSIADARKGGVRFRGLSPTRTRRGPSGRWRGQIPLSTAPCRRGRRGRPWIGESPAGSSERSAG